tara:strand:- start:670 stop:879 length:210 start_codon:yes stop_codon:yes gene_type:complete
VGPLADLDVGIGDGQCAEGLVIVAWEGARMRSWEANGGACCRGAGRGASSVVLQYGTVFVMFQTSIRIF